MNSSNLSLNCTKNGYKYSKMAIPWILGGLAVGAAAWAFSGGDDGGSSSSSNNRYDREQEARKKANEEKKKRLFEEIEGFKKREIGRIKEKYNAQIHIDTIESYAQSVQNELIALSTKFLQQLKSKFGNSFISLAGNIKDESVTKHFEQLGSITDEIKNVIDEFQLDDLFDLQDTANNFEDFFAVVESIQNNKHKILNTLKNRYLIEKSYQEVISKYTIVHSHYMKNEVFEMIVEHIWDNINFYENNFNDTKVTIVKIDENFNLKIKELEIEQKELNQLIDQLKKEQNATNKQYK